MINVKLVVDRLLGEDNNPKAFPVKFHHQKPRPALRPGQRTLKPEPRSTQAAT